MKNPLRVRFLNWCDVKLNEQGTFVPLRPVRYWPLYQAQVNRIPGATRYKQQQRRDRVLDSLNGYDDPAYPYSDPLKSALRNKHND